ncbi:hypothetical protein V8E36_003910 [Tilletia maclaganii]
MLTVLSFRLAAVYVLLAVAYFFYSHSRTRSSSSLLPPFLGHPSRPTQQMPNHIHAAYFPNWAIYGRKSFPQDIDASRLSHILYAFADVDAESGECRLTDKWADEDIHYDGDSWNDPPGGLYGNFKQLNLLKRKHRHLKLLLSIGGWTYSPHFAFASDPHKRTRFVQSILQLLEDYGLDGFDVDWEYPKTKEQAAEYVALLAELRQALDAAEKERSQPTKFWLTIAAPCGSSNIEVLDISGMEKHLDAIMLMAYDYSGSWESSAGHQAKVRGPAPSTEDAVSRYVAGGVPPSKLVLGLPLYGRAFTNTAGPGHHFQGVGEGSWEQGVWDWKALPRAGEHVRVHEDMDAIASWEYDSQARTMISFDTRRVFEAKVEWALQKGLRGAMWWELSADRAGADSALGLVASKLGDLDQTPNCLSYPKSKFSNLRSGFSS